MPAQCTDSSPWKWDARYERRLYANVDGRRVAVVTCQWHQWTDNRRAYETATSSMRQTAQWRRCETGILVEDPAVCQTGFRPSGLNEMTQLTWLKSHAAYDVYGDPTVGHWRTLARLCRSLLRQSGLSSAQTRDDMTFDQGPGTNRQYLTSNQDPKCFPNA